MALQAEHLGPQGKALVRARGGAREALGAGRNAELVAMPVQHGHVAQRGQRGIVPRRRQRQRREADLLHAHGGHRGAERAGDELGAQADAQQWLLAAQPPPHQRQFVGEKGVGRFVERADGAAQHDQQAGVGNVRCVQVFGGGVHVAHGVAPGLEQRLQRAQVFEMQVADGDGGVGHGVVSLQELGQ